MKINTNQLNRTPLVFGLVLLFNFLFWQESLGLNLVLFTTTISITLLGLHRDSVKSKLVRRMLLFSATTAITVLVHNSFISKFAHINSMIILVSFIVQPQLRTVHYGLGTFCANLRTSFSEMLQEIPFFTSKHKFKKTVWNYFKLSIIPIFILTLFFLIYTSANPRFSEFNRIVFGEVMKYFGNLSITWLLFFLFGFIISVGIIYQSIHHKLLNQEQQKSDSLQRKRRLSKEKFSILGLKREYQSALILLLMVNALLFINNVIDIDWIWLNFEIVEGLHLQQFVHEGTYLLILSILLSMGLMLYYFRGNLNFFRENKWLKRLCYIWIIQNAVLVISVGLRNYYYIAYHGLAYKRIGVVFFLLLTLFGLFSLYQKIRYQKSTFFLFRVNSWAAFSLMITLSLVNWDGFIAQYNLKKNYPADVDTHFLLSLSERALPSLVQAQEVFTEENQRIELGNKINSFLEEYEAKSWRSWNLAEIKIYRYLKSIVPHGPIHHANTKGG